MAAAGGCVLWGVFATERESGTARYHISRTNFPSRSSILFPLLLYIYQVYLVTFRREYEEMISFIFPFEAITEQALKKKTAKFLSWESHFIFSDDKLLKRVNVCPFIPRRAGRRLVGRTVGLGLRVPNEDLLEMQKFQINYYV